MLIVASFYSYLASNYILNNHDKIERHGVLVKYGINVSTYDFLRLTFNLAGLSQSSSERYITHRASYNIRSRSCLTL